MWNFFLCSFLFSKMLVPHFLSALVSLSSSSGLLGSGRLCQTLVSHYTLLGLYYALHCKLANALQRKSSGGSPAQLCEFLSKSRLPWLPSDNFRKFCFILMRVWELGELLFSSFYYQVSQMAATLP